MSFSVIMTRPKHARNVGSTVRSADIFGADRIIVADPDKVDGRLNHCTDTAKTFAKKGEVFPDLKTALSTFDRTVYTVVAVELAEDSHNLATFEHPENVVYVMGAENDGLHDDELKLCDMVVQIPSDKSWSLNVSTAASLVCYDRFAKNVRAQG